MATPEPACSGGRWLQSVDEIDGWTVAHVIPSDDDPASPPHRRGTDCACQPLVTVDDRQHSAIVVHNAWDGREYFEARYAYGSTDDARA